MKSSCLTPHALSRELSLHDTVWVKRFEGKDWHLIRCFILSQEPNCVILTPYGLPGHDSAIMESMVLELDSFDEETGTFIWGLSPDQAAQVYEVPGCLNYVPVKEVKVGHRYSLLGITLQGLPLRSQIGIADITSERITFDYLSGPMEGITDGLPDLDVGPDGFMDFPGFQFGRVCFLEYAPPSAGNPIDGHLIKQGDLLWLRVNGFENHPTFYRRAICVGESVDHITLSVQEVDSELGEPVNPSGRFEITRTALSDFAGLLSLQATDAPIGSLIALPCGDNPAEFKFSAEAPAA